MGVVTRTLVVVNGEQDWGDYLPGCTVHYRQLQTSRWLYHQGALWVFDRSGSVRVDAVLWRIGAIRPHPGHRAVLELIRLAGVPCVNPATVLLRGYDRLSMLNDLREAGLPVPEMTVALGDGMLDRFEPVLPCVVKVGNYHGGYGKARPRDAEQWADVRDLIFATEDYVTIEPYVEYARGIRCLAVGGRIWAMSRRGRFWKVNTATEHYEMIPMPGLLRDHTTRAMAHLRADVLGLDFLETADGAYILLESNDTPGLSGFPEEVRLAVAALVRARLDA